LEVNEPTSLNDALTNQIVNYSGAQNLGSAIGFQKYDSLEKNWINAALMFSYNLIDGTDANSTNVELYKEYLFIEKRSRFLFKLAIVPKKRGLFRIVFSNSGNTYRTSDKCTKANFIINFKETNHNRHLVGYTGEDIEGGDLHFIVK
jgi:hypothetical protein